MKLSLVWAAAVVCLVGATGGCGDEGGEDARGVAGGTHSVAEAGVADARGDDRQDAAAVPVQQEGGGGVAPEGGAGGSGYCSPDAACNGVSNCTDTCFGAGCCILQCSCDRDPVDPAGRLVCQIHC